MQLPLRRDSFDPEAICRSYRTVEAPLIVHDVWSHAMARRSQYRRITHLGLFTIRQQPLPDRDMNLEIRSR